MSSTTLPVCPKTGSTSPRLTVHFCLHTAPGNRECAPVVRRMGSPPPCWSAFQTPMRTGNPVRLQPPAPLETAPAGSGAVSDGPPRQRSIHVVKGPDRGKSSSAAGGESVHSGTGADLYVRWSNVAANPNVTSGERTYRQGSDRPCAGLRWPRTANPASGQSLHLPSALHDAHPLWRTQKIWTVIDIEVVSQHANAADVTTAQRGVPLQALQARAPTTIRPAAVDPLTAPRVATFGQIPAVVVRSATALRARPQTDVHFAWSFAARNPTRKAWSPRTGHAAMGGALPAGAAALPRLGRSGNQERFCSSNALASRRSLRMTAVRATFGGFP